MRMSLRWSKSSLEKTIAIIKQWTFTKVNFFHMAMLSRYKAFKGKCIQIVETTSKLAKPFELTKRFRCGKAVTPRQK